MADKRIIEFTNEAMNHSNDDYLAMDSSSSGTRKIKADALLAAEATAREEADDVIKESIDAVKEQLETEYALIDGYYEEMTVGDSEQLLSTKFVEDSTPYIFRTTGGSADVGNRQYVDKIVGGTVAWNQKADIRPGTTINGVSLTNNGDGSVTISGTATATTKMPVVGTAYGVHERVGHKFMFYGIPSGSTETYYMTILFIGETAKDIGKGSIFNMIDTPYNGPLGVVVNNGVAINVTFYPQLFDLTQMFGSAVADSIYAMEQANAGSGVAFFRSLFPYDYYEYDAGTLKSVEGVSSHDTVGFNQWDEEWEVGRIDSTTGADITGNTWARSIGYIKALPNTTYFALYDQAVAGKVGSVSVACYDSDKNFLSFISDTQNKTFTTHPNTAFIRLTMWYSGGVTANYVRGTVCINLSWSGTRNGEYEPYEKHSYPLDSSLTLRGIPKADSSGNLYFDGDEYLPDGTVNRRYAIVDLGTLTWGKTSYCFYGYLPSNSVLTYGDDISNCICSKYVASSGGDILYGRVDKAISASTQVISSGQNRVYVRDTAYSDADIETFKTAMSGVYFIYELGTPITEEALPYQDIQTCDDWGTEEYVTTGIVPVGHETRYPANLRDKIQHLPDLADADGVYAIRQTGTQMELVPVDTPTEIPSAPTTDGSYVLKATVSNGVATYTWEVKS